MAPVVGQRLEQLAKPRRKHRLQHQRRVLGAEPDRPLRQRQRQRDLARNLERRHLERLGEPRQSSRRRAPPPFSGRGSDNAIWRGPGSGGTWSAWESRGNPPGVGFPSDPTLVSWGPEVKPT